MIYAHSIGRAVQCYPEHVAFFREGKPITFRSLDERVRRIATELRSEGLLRGERLALLLPNDTAYIELIYACSLLGAIAVPINTRYALPEIERLMEDARPQGLIRHSTMLKPNHSLGWERVIDEAPFNDAHDLYTEDFYEPDATLALIYTSGTTGRPKGAALSHSGVFSNVHDLHYWMGYRSEAVYLHASPMFHIADFPAFFAAPVFGAAQVVLPRFDAQHFCEVVQQFSVTHTVLVPTAINALCQIEDPGRYNLDSLEVLAYGGSPIAPVLIGRVRSFLPRAKLLQVYGLSETGFLTGLEDADHAGDRLRSCGRTCPGVDLNVVTDSGKPAGVNEIGNLVARGAGIMRGYWMDMEGEPYDEATAGNETEIAFRDGVFHTGDIGYRDADGFFFLVDRAKDMIVTGGENVYSVEVEAAIFEVENVREVAVFGIPDPKWGEAVAAVVVVKPGTGLSIGDVITHCKKVLAGYKVPKHVEIVEEELPKSGSGKILKQAIREKYWKGRPRRVG